MASNRIKVVGNSEEIQGTVDAQVGMTLTFPAGTITNVSDGIITVNTGKKKYDFHCIMTLAEATTNWGWPNGVNCHPRLGSSSTHIAPAHS